MFLDIKRFARLFSQKFLERGRYWGLMREGTREYLHKFYKMWSILIDL